MTIDSFEKSDWRRNELIFDSIWQQFIELAEIELGKRIVDLWIRALRFNDCDYKKKIITIRAPNEFSREWIESHYKKEIGSIFCRIFGDLEFKVSFFCFKRDDSKEIFPALKIEGQFFESEIDRKNKLLKKRLKTENSKFITQSKIVEEHNFESFVVGAGNDSAFVTVKNFIENERVWYNPLFIYGSSGIGKTHLINSVANYLSLAGKDFIYQSSDNFVQNYISSVKNNSIDLFEKAYDSIDVLLIDDIQSFGKKIQTQEIFLKIFINLFSKQKKIIITSDSAPSKINGIIDRLRSRLEGGLVIDLFLPKLETIFEIVRKKAKYFKLDLADEICYYIASLVKKSIREAEGYLIRLAAYSSITKDPLTMDRVIGISGHQPLSISNEFFVTKIVDSVSSRFGVSFEQMSSKSRSRSIVEARHVLMFLLKKYTNKSLNEIAKFLKKSDHTAVLYACRKVERFKLAESKNESSILLIEKNLQAIFNENK
jgi:chromosomal replication initiator protein